MIVIDINNKYPGSFYIQVDKDTNHCMLTIVAGYEDATIWLGKKETDQLIDALRAIEATLDD